MKKRGGKKNFFQKTHASVIHVGFLGLLLILAGASLTVHFVLSANGSGTNTVSPTTAIVSSTGNTHTFTYTASETMDSGGIFIDVPAGFSVAQGIAGIAGYTVVTSASGVVANVKDNLDSTGGWNAGIACTNGLTADTVTKYEGTASLSCVNGNEANNDRWYKNISSENWTSYTKVGFWIRTSSAISAGNLSFDYDDSSSLASVLESVQLPAISANTWTYVVLNFGVTTRTSILSYGFCIRSPNALDNVTVKIDDILMGPGIGTFTNGDIYARILQLSAGQTIVVTYGSGGGASGVVAPSSTGVYTFTTQSRISDAGSLVNISSHPAVTITTAPVSQFALSDPGNMVAGTRLGYTVTRKDQYGNLVTGGSTTVYLYSSSSGSNKRFYNASSGGSIITSIVIGAGSSSANFWYYDEAPGTYTITTSDNASSPDGATGIADATDSVTVSSVAIVATKFNIHDPADTVVGGSVTVIVHAEDNSGNLDTSYQSDVTLVLSGSATGGGLVNIVNGIGTKTITDSVAETVNLTLSDTQGTGLNVSSTQDIVFFANETLLVLGSQNTERSQPTVRFYGQAYPGAEISVLEKIGETLNSKAREYASASGSFSITITELITGARTYGIIIKDKNGIATPVKFYNLDLNFSAAPEVEIFAEPTTNLAKIRVAPGEKLNIYGFGTPNMELEFMIGEKSFRANYLVDDTGNYKIDLDTSGVATGNQTIKVRQINPKTGNQSDWSIQQSFTISKTVGLLGDLNGDDKINISDWSIFLSIWGRGTEIEKKKIDLNGDGKINISDFSLFIINFKK